MTKMIGKFNRRVAEAEEATVMKAQGLIDWIMDLSKVTNKELAERLGISQAGVARRLGLSQKNLSVKKLARVLNALGDKLVISSEEREAYLRATDHSRVLEFARHSVRAGRVAEYAESLRASTHANDDFGLFGEHCIPKREQRIWQVHEAA